MNLKSFLPLVVIECVLLSSTWAQPSIQHPNLQGPGISACLQQKQQDGRIKGSIVYPSNATYDATRRTTSRLWSAWPVGILQAESETDVSEAIRCAILYKTKFTVRSGGHGNAGQAVMTGTLTIDLSRMNTVSLSKDAELAYVDAGATAGAAIYWINKYSNGTRSIPVGQKPTVGISGLGLGGGFGFTTRLAGLLCDRLHALTMVLPDGSIVSVTEKENSDLFWASCGGGGGNFGIVTRFIFRTINTASPYTQFKYLIPFDPKENLGIIRFYQEWSLRLDPRATANMEFTSTSNKPTDAGYTGSNLIPSWLVDVLEGIRNGTTEFPSKAAKILYKALKSENDIPLLTVVGIFRGTEEEFYQALAASGLTSDTPLSIDGFFLQQGTLMDAILDLSGWNTTTPESLLDSYQWENTYYKYKSFFLSDPLPDEAIQLALNSAYVDNASSVVFEFQSLGGWSSAFSAIGPTDTAFSHRNARHCFMLKSNAGTLEQGSRALGDMEALWRNMLPFVQGQAAYVNHLDTDIWDFQRSYYGLTGYGGINGKQSNINRLAIIAEATNANSGMANVQPCCSPIQARK